MSRVRSLYLAALLTILVGWLHACSLHYNQQADSQTLDIEIMRLVTTAQTPNNLDPEP